MYVHTIWSGKSGIKTWLASGKTCTRWLLSPAHIHTSIYTWILTSTRSLDGFALGLPLRLDSTYHNFLLALWKSAVQTIVIWVRLPSRICSTKVCYLALLHTTSSHSLQCLQVRNCTHDKVVYSSKRNKLTGKHPPTLQRTQSQLAHMLVYTILFGAYKQLTANRLRIAHSRPSYIYCGQEHPVPSHPHSRHATIARSLRTLNWYDSQSLSVCMCGCMSYA